MSDCTVDSDDKLVVPPVLRLFDVIYRTHT